MSPRSATVWCALLVNASTRRLVLASTTATRRVQPAAFISTSGVGRHGKTTPATTSPSTSSSSSRGFITGVGIGGERRPAARELLMGSCVPSNSWCGACRSSRAQHQPQLNQRSQARARWQLHRGFHVSRATAAGSQPAAMSTAAAEAGTESGVPLPIDGSSVGSDGTGSEDDRLRVTLLSGFLGAGKTTLMRNVLRQAREERLSLAVIVNDMADVNIDAQLLALGGEPEAGGLGEPGVDVRSVGSGDNGASVAMQDGCICCTLREDLLFEVESIAREGKHQHLIIESTGISDPNPVAEALVASDEENDEADHAAGKGGLFSLDTLVTVVDSTSFLEEVRKADDLEERGLEAEEGDTRTIADLLVSQVEFANVILLNKADLATPADMATLEALVRRLNPAARIVRTVSSEIGLKEVVGTGEFDLDEASQAAGWLQALNDEESEEHPAHGSTSHQGGDCHDGCSDDTHEHVHQDTPVTDVCADDACQDHGDHSHAHSGGSGTTATTSACGDAACQDPGCCPPSDNDQARGGSGAAARSRPAETFGIGSFTFRARRPFHPERLMGFVMGHMPSVLRSKGFLWLATRHDSAGVWNQAGGSFATEYGGSWDGGDEEGDDTDSSDDHAERHDGGAQAAAAAVPPAVGGVGDGVDDDGSNTRRNELVFIGLGMDEVALRTELRLCLLSEEEMAGGPESWNRRFSDPFPPWE